MKETGAPEDEARQHIKLLINEAWKQINEDWVTNSPFSHTFNQISINLTRMTMWFYEHTDGFGVENHGITKYHASLLFVYSIPLGCEGANV